MMFYPLTPEKTYKNLLKYCLAAGIIIGGIAGLGHFIVNDLKPLVSEVFSQTDLILLAHAVFLFCIFISGFALFGAVFGIFPALAVFHITHCILYVISINYKEFCRYSKNYILDRSFWSLFGYNMITIIWGVYENWSLAVIVWLYCFQNMIVGFIWFMRLLLKDSFTGLQFAFSFSFFHIAAGFILYKWNMPITFDAIMAALIYLMDQSYFYWCTRDSGFWDVQQHDFWQMPWQRVYFLILFLFPAYLLKKVFCFNFEILSLFSVFCFLTAKMLVDLIMYFIHREKFITDKNSLFDSW